jgi:uncharacterized membrane protein
MEVILALVFLLIPVSIFIWLLNYPGRKRKQDMQFLLDRKLMEIETKYEKKEISRDTYLRLIEDAIETYK